jgi:hypothetical protein
MEFTEWMLLKGAVMLVIIAIVGFIKGFTGR